VPLNIIKFVQQNQLLVAFGSGRALNATKANLAQIVSAALACKGGLPNAARRIQQAEADKLDGDQAPTNRQALLGLGQLSTRAGIADTAVRLPQFQADLSLS
jgi:hypothetical protein